MTRTSTGTVCCVTPATVTGTVILMAGGAPLPLAPLSEHAGRNMSQARIRMRAGAGIDFRQESCRASCSDMTDSFNGPLSPHSYVRPTLVGFAGGVNRYGGK